MTEVENSSLTNSDFTDEDCNHATEVWDTLNINNMGEYQDIYLATDVLLANVFENFRTLSYKAYDLDCARYVSMPSFSLDALLKGASFKPELLSDPEMYKFVESG